MIEVAGLSFGYPRQRPILRNVEVSVGDGCVLGVFGRSGVGKSTFLRLLAGLERPLEGRIVVNGAVVNGPSKNVGLMFQSYALFDWFSCIDNLRVAMRMGGQRSTRADCFDLLDRVGLASVADAFPRTLSGGMRQRLALARAMSTRPQALLLDEPFSALDMKTKADTIVSTFANIRANSLTAVLVAHDPATIIEYCDQIAILSGCPAQISVPSAISADLRAARSSLNPAERHALNTTVVAAIEQAMSSPQEE
jgi:NitT/TauT family transport system ATP-binding protein